MSLETSSSNSTITNTNTSISTYILLVLLLFAASLTILNTFPAATEYYYGADEGIYLSQATAIKENGLGGLKKITEEYIAKPEKQLFPPPLRVLHIYIIGILLSFRDSITTFSYYSLFCFIATTIISFIFVRKFWGEKIALITSIFMMFSPLNMGLARRALMDSSYTLFTLITLALFVNFINSKTSKNYLYFISSLVFLLLYKETTYFYMPFFVLSLLIIKYFYDKSLEFSYIVKTALIPYIIAFVVYLLAFGSLGNVIAVFKGLFLPNFLVPLQYAVDYCSGPWYHYFIDYFIVIPIISLLFFLYLGYYFLNSEKNLATSILIGFLFYFVVIFSLFFKNIRYGMTLNFIYSLLAALMLVTFLELYLSKINLEGINKSLGIKINLQRETTIIIVALISFLGIKTDNKFFVQDKMYDTAMFYLLQSEKMVPSNYINPTPKTTPSTVKSEEVVALEQIAKQILIVTDSPTQDNYLNLSLYYYQAKLYQESIVMGKKVLELNPKNVFAYNNICSAYIFLGEYDKAIEAANKALEIDPNFQLAKNNLNWAKDVKAKAEKK